jgi:hypothetical protein
MFKKRAKTHLRIKKASNNYEFIKTRLPETERDRTETYLHFLWYNIDGKEWEREKLKKIIIATIGYKKLN